MKTIFSAVLMLVFFLFIGGAHAAQTCKSSIAVATPTSRFTLNGDGTVTDNTTGLMWKQCVEGLSGAGCAAGSASTMDWKAALDHAATHSFAGYSDWRLANIKELGSIVETACLSPAVNLAVFPNTPSSLVWSASP